MMFLKPGKRLRVFAALLMLVSSNSAVFAADYTWIGPTLPETSRGWEDFANWDTLQFPTIPGDTANSAVLFAGASPGDVNLSVDRSINVLEFSGTGGYILNNNALNLPSGNTLIQAGSGVNVINTQLNVTGLAGTVSGGTLSLANTNNSITGSMTVTGGTLGVTGLVSQSGLGNGSVTLSGGTLAITAAPVVSAGLVGQYWQTGTNPDTNWFTSLANFDAHFGPIAPTVVSSPGSFPASFDFNNAGFGGNNPFSEAGINIGADTVAARWTGFYTPGSAETVDFFTRSDDGSMLFIDGQLVVDNNFYQGATTRQGAFTFADTNPHQIDVLFYEGGGGAGVTVSQGFDGNFIPNTQLSSTVPTAAILSNPVNVTANSTLASTGTGVATVGATTVDRGVQLSTSGTIGSSSFTASGAGAAPVTINALDGTYTAPGLNDGGNAANFVKTGPGVVKLTNATPTLVSNSSMRVDQGTLKVVSSGTGSSLGNAPIQLNGGTISVSATATAVPGLFGKYWQTGSNPDTNWFNSMAAFNGHFGPIAPTATTGSDAFPSSFDFNNAGYGGNSPFGEAGIDIGADTVASHWSGLYTPAATGPMEFFTRSDDGSMLFIDGVLVVSNNFYQGATTRSGTFTFNDTEPHQIDVLFYEGGGGAGVTVSHGFDGNFIPKTQLSFLQNLPAVMSNPISVTANSTLVAENGDNITVGPTSINRGVQLSTSGTISSTSLTAAGSGAAPVTISPQNGTYSVPGLSDGGNAANFVKSGAGNLALTSPTSSLIAPASTVNVNQGRLLAVGDAAGSSLGAAPVTLSGGTLNVSTAGSVSGLVANVYDNVAGFGLGNENLGALFSMTPTATVQLNGALNFPQDADTAFRNFFGNGNPVNDIFTASFTGTFVATTSGTYQFAATRNDDTSVIWIDRDHDGVFSHSGKAGDEMIQIVGCCNNTGVASVNLPAGDYKIVLAVEDGGGGSGLVGNFADPGGSLNIINPNGQSGRFLTEVGTANFSATNVHVTANSTLEGGAATGGATLGNTTIDRGTTLTTTGTLNMASVAASGAGSAASGLNVSSGLVNIGSLKDGGANATFVKNGVGEANLTGETPNTFNAAATVNVQAGTLTVTNSAAGVTSLSSGANNAHVVLSGGTLNVNAVATATLEPGLKAQFYDRAPYNFNNQDPTFNALSTMKGTLDGLTPNVTAIVPNVDYPDSGGAPFASAGYNTTDNIAARFTGKVRISAAQAADPNGVTFGTVSDDGSVLFIDGQEVPVVNNNFFQGMTLRGGTIFGLTEGDHDIVIGFYEGGGGAGVQAGWLDNGNQVLLPAEVLFHEVFGTTPVAYNNTVRVTADSILSSNGVVASAFGAMTMDAGVKLTKNGAQNSGFASTSLRGNSTFDVASASLSLGTTTDNTNTTILTKVGAGTLVVNQSSNDLNGTDILVNAGTLALSAAGGLNTAKSLTVNNGGTFDIRDEALVDNVPVKMNPGSALAVSSASGSVANLLYNGGSFSGPALNVTNSLGGVGNLDITKVALAANVTIAPGNPGVNDSTGTLTITGDLSHPATGALAIQLAGTDADLYDHLAVNGAYAPAGTLAVTLVNGFQPNTGDHFADVYSATTLVGAFGASSGLNLGNGLRLNPVSTPTSVGLLAALPGDADLNRTADFTDLGVLLNNFNTNAGFGVGEWSLGDFNDDHVVDFTDLGILLNNFNQTTPLVASAQAVPEPSSMALLSLGLVGMALAGLRARRRKA